MERELFSTIRTVDKVFQVSRFIECQNLLFFE